MWDWDAFFGYYFHPLILKGVVNTLWISVASIGIGIVLGLIFALMLMSKNPILNKIAGFYTWAWRGTPLLVQLILIFAGLPRLGLRLTVLQSALAGLGINEGAYMAEIIRGGILSVNPGQLSAATALGMNYTTRMRLIIIPQAMRFIVPAFGNRMNGMIKMSSLASVVSMSELLRSTQTLIQERFKVLELFIVATFWYLTMTSIWNLIQIKIEEYYGRGYKETKATKKVAPKKAFSQ